MIRDLNTPLMAKGNKYLEKDKSELTFNFFIKGSCEKQNHSIKSLALVNRGVM